jgi:hypothetical protein
MILEGTLVDKRGNVRTILTSVGPMRCQLGGFFNYPLYVGEWAKVEGGGQMGWLGAATVASNMTRAQKTCDHSWVTWTEPYRVPTKLHTRAPARLLFCVTCTLALVFKL